jgi:hypothetical protein
MKADGIDLRERVVRFIKEGGRSHAQKMLEIRPHSNAFFKSSMTPDCYCPSGAESGVCLKNKIARGLDFDLQTECFF